MDNLKAHIKGVRLLPPPNNVRIEWFPANSTSIYQPLDQGIIRTTKHYYKKHWMEYMVYQYEQEVDPIKTLDIRTAIIWVTKAWFDEVDKSVFVNCYRKATVIPRLQVMELPSTELDLEPLYQHLQEVGQFQQAMAFSDFLEPPEEVLQDEHESDDPMAAIMEEYLHQEDVEEDDEEEPPPPRVPTDSEAAQALQTLLQHQICQADSQHHDIRFLQRMERRLALTAHRRVHQDTLYSYFT